MNYPRVSPEYKNTSLHRDQHYFYLRKCKYELCNEANIKHYNMIASQLLISDHRLREMN